jgi:molybdopterin/thiamine biosynthesis adenylyltransferase/predicted RNA-binding Zn-ribbon protein involved in translation (DUF1610 family)
VTLSLDHAALAPKPDEDENDEGDRYHRQGLIDWWEQARVSAARVLVVGAGALGNEILKLLALTGVGRTLVYDPDLIERSNLSRCVLFRDADEGEAKADVAVRRMREINPEILAVARRENVIERAGLGAFAWADVVVAGVDNREARVFVSSACARTGKSWVDGAIEALSGVVRVFEPRHTACYECTMNATDRKLLAERRSCALLARSVVARGHVPTTAVAASIVAALQVQEALKLLHGQPTLRGEGLYIDGLQGEVTRVRYTRREDCLGHEEIGVPVPLGRGVADVTLEALLARAEADLGPGAELHLSRDVVVSFACPGCGATARVGAPLGAVREAQARCPACGAHRIPEITATIGRGRDLDLAVTPADIGVPPFDIIVARRGLDAERAYLFDADAENVLGAML